MKDITVYQLVLSHDDCSKSIQIIHYSFPQMLNITYLHFPIMHNAFNDPLCSGKIGGP